MTSLPLVHAAVEAPAALLGIAAALAVGVVSPGPSFVMVARTALAVSRRDGVAAAVGMGFGGVFFAALALLGLHAALAAVPLLHAVLKALGGAYLIHLGYRIWRGSGQALVVNGAPRGGSASVWRSFAQGLATQISNPKTAVVYASVFASLLPREVPPAALVVLPCMVFVIETGWYAAVAVGLSAPTPRARYLAAKTWLDRGAGAIMAALGTKLVLEAATP